MSEEIKKALRIAVNVGCGFEGDAEDAASLLGLIETNEARIAELEKYISQLVEVGGLLAECSEYEGGKIAWDELVYYRKEG